MRKFLSFIIVLFLILSIIALFLYKQNNQKSDEELLKEKSLSELEFIEDTTFCIVEKYLTKSYFDDEEMNWDNIKSDFNVVLNNSSSMIIDLTNLKIENSEILEFETRINEVNLAIENKGEMAILESLSNFYKLIPDYTNKIYPENENLYLEREAKSYLLESLYYSMIDDFEQSLNLLQSAEDIYQNLMGKIDYLESYKLNRIYVAVQEMKLSIQNQQKENVKAKYINTL